LIPTAGVAPEAFHQFGCLDPFAPRNGRFPLKFLTFAGANRKIDKLGLLVAEAVNR